MWLGRLLDLDVGTFRAASAAWESLLAHWFCLGLGTCTKPPLQQFTSRGQWGGRPNFGQALFHSGVWAHILWGGIVRHTLVALLRSRVCVCVCWHSGSGRYAFRRVLISWPLWFCLRMRRATVLVAHLVFLNGFGYPYHDTRCGAPEPARCGSHGYNVGAAVVFECGRRATHAFLDYLAAAMMLLFFQGTCW